jgi:type I restriction enzyme, S subunit
VIGDLKPYAEYKGSGLPWLGQVPRHWEVRRIKTVLRETDRRSTDGEGTLLSLTRVRGLIPHREMTDKMHSAKTLVGYKCYREGQLVMNRMQAWSGMFGAGPTEGLVSPDYAVFDVLGDHSVKFLLERLKAPDLVEQFALESKGIGSGFNRLYTDRFGPIPVPLPPPGEQAAIVRFLDWANGRLERAIRAKRKGIALLNEQKQVIIHRAVTRGLDPTVPLKDSGIPWIGEIPAHWEVRRVKSLSLVKRGASPRPISDMRFFDEAGEYAWVRIKDVTASKRYLETTTERLSDLGKSRSVPLEPGAIFLSIAGSVGKPTITRIKCCIHDGFVYFPQFNGGVDFLSYVFSSGRVYDGLGKLGTQLNLNTETVGSIRVPWPPVVEQEHVAAHLDEELTKFEIAISRLEREIAFLREYRTRLVADVVTGKLDVREAASRLLDEELLPDLPAADDECDDLPIEEEDAA